MREMKTCTKCGEVKPLDEFHRDGKGGRRSDCKVCISARDRAYREANREQIRAYYQSYYESNREQILAYNRARYESNREQILAYNRAYYGANREEVNARNRTYYRANRERILTYNRAYHQPYYQANRERIMARTYARKRSLEPPCEDTLEYMRWLRKDPCSYCGKWPEPGETSAIDHIVPISAGGANHWTNITAACGPCNSSKGSKPLMQWLVERERKAYDGIGKAQMAEVKRVFRETRGTT